MMQTIARIAAGVRQQGERLEAVGVPSMDGVPCHEVRIPIPSEVYCLVDPSDAPREAFVQVDTVTVDLVNGLPPLCVAIRIAGCAMGAVVDTVRLEDDLPFAVEALRHAKRVRN